MSRDQRTLEKTTGFGFNWGALVVERLYEDKGHVVVGLRSDRQRMEVRVTPTGLIRPSKVKPAYKETALKVTP